MSLDIHEEYPDLEGVPRDQWKSKEELLATLRLLRCSNPHWSLHTVLRAFQLLDGTHDQGLRLDADTMAEIDKSIVHDRWKKWLRRSSGPGYGGV